MALAGFGDRVEGFHAVRAALGAGRVERLWVEESRLRRPEIANLIREAERAGSEVRTLSDVRTVASSDAPQGLVATCRLRAFATLEQVAAATTPSSVLVLDHVIDPQNLGAMARSVAAAGLGGMVISGQRAAPLSAVAFKAAAGALESVKVAQVNSIADSLLRLKKLGLWAVGLASDGDQLLWGLPLLTEPVALVIGEEGSGLTRLVAERTDLLVRIPISDAVNSLNASVAAALAVFEVARVRGT